MMHGEISLPLLHFWTIFDYKEMCIYRNQNADNDVHGISFIAIYQTHDTCIWQREHHGFTCYDFVKTKIPQYGDVSTLILWGRGPEKKLAQSV